jgi:hypothetical protein
MQLACRLRASRKPAIESSQALADECGDCPADPRSPAMDAYKVKK